MARLVRDVRHEIQWAICTAWLDTGRTPMFADVDVAVVEKILGAAGRPDPIRVADYLEELNKSPASIRGRPQDLAVNRPNRSRTRRAVPSS